MDGETRKFKSNMRQRCFIFGREVIFLADKLPNRRVGWIIGDQIIRAATSIGANLYEARGASSKLEYKKYFEISLRSANETGYWLELLSAIGLLDEKRIKDLNAELTEIIKMLTSSILTMKRHLNSTKN